MLTYVILGLIVAAVFIGLGLQNVGASEERRRLGALLGLFPSNGRISVTGDTHTSTTLDTLSSFGGIEPGMTVTGPDIPADTTVIAVTSAGGGAVTLSQAATGTHAGGTYVFTFLTGSAQIHLFKAPFSGGVDPVPADFTEADFDTYAALDLPYPAGPYSNPDGTAEADFGDLSWVLFADPVTSNTIYGYWIDYLYPAGGATRVVSCWETLPTPIVMDANGNAVVISVPITLPLPGSASTP